MLALFVVEVPIAHEDAFVMCVFIGVLADGDARATHGRRSSIAMALAATFVPALIPSWDAGVNVDMGVTILLISMAMFAFFGLVQANHAAERRRAARSPGWPPRASAAASPATSTTSSATR